MNTKSLGSENKIGKEGFLLSFYPYSHIDIPYRPNFGRPKMCTALFPNGPNYGR